MNQPFAPPHFRGEFWLDDATRDAFAGAAGILRARPRAVAAPRDAEDVAALVRWAAQDLIPLVPRAAATGMPGGNVGRGVAVDLLRHFRALGPVDAERRRARALPGATLEALNAACAPAALQLPVDPSSGARCTLGGMIANNSAGAHSVKYGAMRPWVEALEVVLATGERARLERGAPPSTPTLRAIQEQVDAALLPERERILAAWPRVRKNSSGYALKEYLESGDLLDLVVGSEGTLALVTAAEVRLAPVAPRRGVALLEFASLEAAGAAVETVLALGPATCEILDRTFIELVRSAGVDPGYPLRAGLEAILLVEMEGQTDAEVAAALERVRESVVGIAAHVSLATEPARQASFWRVRRAASPLIAQRGDGRVSMQFIEDGVVPVERLADYIRALRRVLAAHGVPAVIFGHAGDGNLHVNPLVPVYEPGWRETIERILWTIADEVRALGGTMSGEHGDGRLRAPLLETIWGTAMVARFRAVKDAFDPLGVLNPGVILPLPGQRPLEALRDYDAAAPAPPPAVPGLPD